MPLNKRINLNRRAKSGCEYVIKHFKDVSICASFSVQNIEVFPGAGYKSKDGPVNRKNRLNREDYWKETLRTSYPCGLNERKKKIHQNLSVRYSFPLISRSRQRSVRCSNKAYFDKVKSMESIFICAHNYIADDNNDTYR